MVEDLHKKIKVPIADYTDATIYFTLILIKRGGIDVDKLRDKLDYHESLSLDFESIYDISYRFFYNNTFANKLKITYLGHICEYETTLGPMRLDYFLVENNMIDMMGSLHIHFNFVKSRFNLTEEDYKIKKLSTILRDIYNLVEDISSDKDSSDTEFLSRFKDTLKELNIKSKREHALSISRYMYISVCNLRSLKLEHLEKLEHCWENIFKLLYFHAEGVDAKIAEEKLKKDMWTSTNFYLNFYQPGALLSLSTPYPKDTYKKHISYFLPNLNDRGEIVLGDPPKDERNDKWYENYDLLPEYPALRYMGMASLEFSGVIEELLRGLYDDLMELQRKQYLIRLIMASYKLPDIETAYIACKHLEYIKLPILRDFISRLIRNKHQEAIDESINYLNSYLSNRMILILTILAIILTIIELDVVGVALERLKDIISSVKL